MINLTREEYFVMGMGWRHTIQVVAPLNLTSIDWKKFPVLVIMSNYLAGRSKRMLMMVVVVVVVVGNSKTLL